MQPYGAPLRIAGQLLVLVPAAVRRWRPWLLENLGPLMAINFWLNYLIACSLMDALMFLKHRECTQQTGLGYILAGCYLLVPLNMPPAPPRYYLGAVAAFAALATSSFLATRLAGVCFLPWHHAPAAETAAQLAAAALCAVVLLRRERGFRAELQAARAAGKVPGPSLVVAAGAGSKLD